MVMSRDDLVYACMLALSLLAALFMRVRVGRTHRAAFSCCVGFAMAVFVCGTSVWHSLVNVAALVLLRKFAAKNRLHIYCFAFCFGYLAFFRSCHWLGFAKPPPYSNAIQLLMVLRLVGLAFHMKDSEITAAHSMLLRGRELPLSSLDIFQYCYCYVGLLTGPYFHYATYRDMIDDPHRMLSSQTAHQSEASSEASSKACSEASSKASSNIWRRVVARKLGVSAALGLAYLAVSHAYPVQLARSDWLFVTTRQQLCGGLAYRLFVAMMLFVAFRLRMYFAWSMSEAVCIAANLGVYPAHLECQSGRGPAVPPPPPTSPPPHSPSQTNSQSETSTTKENAQINYSTVKNIDIAGCELAITIRQGMRCWNMTVQYWLATFVYQRVPSKKLRTALTMLVSAYWHGIHPGYYLSFMLIPLALHGEHCLMRLLSLSYHSEQFAKLSWRSPASHWFVWFMRFRLFDAAAIGFLLLTAEATWRFWRSTYFLVHLAYFSAILAARLIKRPPPPANSQSE